MEIISNEELMALQWELSEKKTKSAWTGDLFKEADKKPVSAVSAVKAVEFERAEEIVWLNSGEKDEKIFKSRLNSIFSNDPFSSFGFFD